jgi:hypothetical protein
LAVFFFAAFFTVFFAFFAFFAMMSSEGGQTKCTSRESVCTDKDYTTIGFCKDAGPAAVNCNRLDFTDFLAADATTAPAPFVAGVFRPDTAARRHPCRFDENQVRAAGSP